MHLNTLVSFPMLVRLLNVPPITLWNQSMPSSNWVPFSYWSDVTKCPANESLSPAHALEFTGSLSHVCPTTECQANESLGPVHAALEYTGPFLSLVRLLNIRQTMFHLSSPTCLLVRSRVLNSPFLLVCWFPSYWFPALDNLDFGLPAPWT